MAEVAAAAKERKILVAVDQGEESMYALQWCLNNIVSQNPNSKDTLILLYAKPPRAVYSALDGSGRLLRQPSEGYMFSSDILATMEKYSEEVADSVIHKAKRLCKDLIKEVKVESRVECGDARDVICEMAEKWGVDMVVMGCHGYGAIKRAFLGSVSNHCAQNIKCPVLIVKKPKTSAVSVSLPVPAN